MKDRTKRRLVKGIIIGVAALIVIFITLMLVVVELAMNDNFGRVDKREFSIMPDYEQVADGYPRREISFMSGSNTLRGGVFNEGQDKGLIVLSHGLGGGAESYLTTIMNLVDNGWTVLAYDNTGSMSSDGGSTRGLLQSRLDLDAALTYIETSETELSKLPLLLLGHSWGGYAVASALDLDHDITAAISLAGYYAPLAMLTDQAFEMMGGFANIVMPFMQINQFFRFGSDWNHSAVKAINSSKVPILIVQGSDDGMVAAATASIYSQRERITNPNVEYNYLEGIGHSDDLLTSPDAMVYLAQMDEVYGKLYEQYGGKIPHDVEKEFYDGIDKLRICEANGELMDRINSFFEQAIN